MYLHEFSKKWINNSILIFGLKLSLFFTHYTSCVYFWIKFIYLTILTSIFFQSGDWGGKINHRFIFLHLYLNCFFVTLLLFCPFFNVSVILTRLPRKQEKMFQRSKSICLYELFSTCMMNVFSFNNLKVSSICDEKNCNEREPKVLKVALCCIFFYYVR